jgi:hypothetical protein
MVRTILAIVSTHKAAALSTFQSISTESDRHFGPQYDGHSGLSLDEKMQTGKHA